MEVRHLPRTVLALDGDQPLAREDAVLDARPPGTGSSRVPHSRDAVPGGVVDARLAVLSSTHLPFDELAAASWTFFVAQTRVSPSPRRDRCSRRLVGKALRGAQSVVGALAAGREKRSVRRAVSFIRSLLDEHPSSWERVSSPPRVAARTGPPAANYSQSWRAPCRRRAPPANRRSRCASGGVEAAVATAVQLRDTANAGPRGGDAFGQGEVRFRTA